MRGRTPGSLTWNPAVFGYKMETGDDLTFDERDSAPFMPKCRRRRSQFRLARRAGRRNVPWDQTIVYEAHVKGFTKLHPAVAEKLARHLCRPRPAKPVVDYI